MNNFSAKLDSIAKPFSNLAPWLLRMSLGVAFFLHGYGKFPLPPEKMVGWFSSIGIPAPELISSMVAIGEVAAGIGIIVGGILATSLGHLITRLSGGAVAVIMVGALSIAHADWFVTTKLFTSEQIFLLALGLYFAIKGND
ncbi:MAG: DoxX family protein [Porticoccaceae bacterium]|nr:DoxX family protein [Porticoccaceae bacterium]MDG1475001.1 DoxX family protein [Porticoccaceae bacterium]